jgi:hypothetical protein
MVFHRLMRESEGSSFISTLGHFGDMRGYGGYGNRGGALNMDNFSDNTSGDGRCVRLTAMNHIANLDKQPRCQQQPPVIVKTRTGGAVLSDSSSNKPRLGKTHCVLRLAAVIIRRHTVHGSQNPIPDRPGSDVRRRPARVVTVDTVELQLASAWGSELITVSTCKQQACSSPFFVRHAAFVRCLFET